MSESCCSTTKDGACSLPPNKPRACPSCGKKGKPLAVLTVKSLVRDHTRVPASVSYSFCRTPECDVVYFSDQAVFNKPDLKVRVGIKETADPVPLCYCFDYSREDVRRDIEKAGVTTILDDIKAEVQAGFCACEVKNPSGACCLGDITRAIQEAEKHAAPTVPRVSLSCPHQLLPSPRSPGVGPSLTERSSHDQKIRPHRDRHRFGRFDRRSRVPFRRLGSGHS